MMIIGERVPDILKAAEVAGLRITQDELSATHRRDLIPRPNTRSLGYGRGTESIYPWGTTNQLIAYGRLKQQFGTDYERIGWELWRLGFPVGDRYWRTPLLQASATLAHVAHWAIDAGDSGEQSILSEKAITAIEIVTHKRSQTRAIGAIRRKLRGRFPALLTMTLEVAFGFFKMRKQSDCAEHEYEKSVFARLLGTEAARNKRKPALPPSSFLIFVDEFATMLETIAGVFSKYLTDGPLNAFSEKEIVEAIYEFTMLFNFFLSIERVETQAYGRSSPALHLLALMARDMNVKRHAFFLVVWLVARKIPSIGRGTRQFLDEINRPPSLNSPQSGF